MKTVAELVSSVESKGIRLFPTGEDLSVVAPRSGLVTADLRAKLVELKPAILEHLNARLELQGTLIDTFNSEADAYLLSGFSSIEAERMAASKTKTTPQFRQWLALI